MPSRVSRAAAYLLVDPARFSQYVLEMPLYRYQLLPIRAVVDSVLHQRGREFLLIFPRQAGKNEAVAHLLVYLLNLLQRKGGQIVFGAIGDGLGRGIRRLEERLGNKWNQGNWSKGNKPDRRILGEAAVAFLSTHPQAFSRGETAHWLLVVDELQDQDAAHLEAVFEPMRAANNATALYIGTVRFSHDALWQKKRQLEALEAADGCRRVFLVSPDAVTRDNAHYGAFLQAKLRKFGEQHPIVKSEYFLQPIDSEGGLFPPRRLQLMRGTHSRTQDPAEATTYLATLDVAGQDEASTDPVAQLAHPGRDYTVATIFRLVPPAPGAPGPTYEAVDVFADHGSRHFQDLPGKPALIQRLLAWLRHWRAAHVVCDATGVGEGVADALAGALGPSAVTPFKFTTRTKAELGSNFLSLVETGRFHYWIDDEDLPLSPGWWFWKQAEACAYELPPGGTWDRDLRWEVPASARTSTPAGLQPTHDDRLISAALVAVYDDLIAEGKIRTGRARSTIIKPPDPLDNLSF